MRLFLFLFMVWRARLPASQVCAATTIQDEAHMLPTASGSGAGPGHQTLALGETMKLDHLGPIIINADGTTRRITNWDTLSEQEKQSSWRIIGARNRKRLEKLKRDLRQTENDIAVDGSSVPDAAAGVESSEEV